MNFRMEFSISAKKSHWDFDRDCIESVDQCNTLGSIDILTILSFSIHEDRMSFHLLVSFISFSNVLLFSVYKSFTCLVKLNPKYFFFLMLLKVELFSKFPFQMVRCIKTQLIFV